MRDQDRISPDNIKQTNNNNKEKYQLGDYWLIQYKILVIFSFQQLTCEDK